MDLGVFLDLDGVVTPKPVNLQYASFLGVEKELASLEDRWAAGAIDNAQFNAEFIPLFRKAGFSKEFAATRFSGLVFNTFAEELIQINLPNTFFVTSSPSYFVEQYARKFGVPKSNIICSAYAFDGTGLISECVSPCGVVEKASFVKSRAKRFNRTVGVGDTPEQDAKFLSECDVRILMKGERSNYLNAPDLYGVVALIKFLRDLAQTEQSPEATPLPLKKGVERLLAQSDYEKNVFLMTPFRADVRYQTALSVIKEELQQQGFRGWTADELDLDEDYDLWTNVRSFMHACKSGVALLTAEETTRGNTIRVRSEVFNPNVLLEAGYMIGQRKEVILFKDRRVKMPADLLGKIVVPVTWSNPAEEIRSGMRRWLKRRTSS